MFTHTHTHSLIPPYCLIFREDTSHSSVIHIRKREYSCTHPVCTLQLVQTAPPLKRRPPPCCDLCGPPLSVCRSILFHLNLRTRCPLRELEGSLSHVSSHPVLPHQRDDAGRRTRLRQAGVFEKLVGRGPLSRVSHQHPIQEALEQRGDLGEERNIQVFITLSCGFVKAKGYSIGKRKKSINLLWDF